MPDWTYQTIFKRPLAKLGFDRGTALAFGSMGKLGSLPGGKWLIRLMGHMSPDDRLEFRKRGLGFKTRVGLGCRIDRELRAPSALAEFGISYLEVGPIVEHASGEQESASIDFQAETIQQDSKPSFLTAESAGDRLRRIGDLNVLVWARLGAETPESALRMMVSIRSKIDAFVLPAVMVASVSDMRATHSNERIRDTPLLAALHHDEWNNEAIRNQLLELFQSERAAGIVLLSDESQIGKVNEADSLVLLEEIRKQIGLEPLLIGSVGIHEPEDALLQIDAGADLVQIDSGLVFAGPGLPKRINEAVLYQRHGEERAESIAHPLPQQSWFWSFLMGTAMFVGGIMAMAIAMTRIVMPYDETSIGMLRGDLMRINERLLPFMQHDRVTLAGTMLAIGVLYISLALFGIRRGAHWAYIAIVVSATTGFFSFFTFLGFGYFDPFHAFVSAVLLQFLLLTTVLPQPAHRHVELPDLWNDGRWRRHQWGQLSFVVHGSILIVAGVVISIIGMTSVFVIEDLEFLRCTERVLLDANPMLVPLVAHDRATFGGMLIATGFATLLAGLWGFRHGQAWLWWALMIAGNIAYCSAISVHWLVGYNSLKHLIPAYGGLMLLWLGGWASYAFMVQGDPKLTAEWRRRLDSKSEADAPETCS